MDLLAIFSSLRRHPLIFAVIVFAVIGGNVFVLFGIPPKYESQAQYVLVSPPAPPTDAQIERDPSLAKLNNNNPYARLPSSVVVEVLAQRVSGDAVRRELIAQGADKNYQISSTNTIGNGLVIQITGTGSSARQAGRTLDLVWTRTRSELQNMQTVDGADSRFLFQALAINAPTDATRKITGTVRSLIAVTVAGVILLFGFISVAEALPSRRGKRRQAGGPAVSAASSDSDLTMVLPRMPRDRAGSSTDAAAKDLRSS
jgi:capsular polysaccharide biosynthesis protein